MKVQIKRQVFRQMMRCVFVTVDHPGAWSKDQQTMRLLCKELLETSAGTDPIEIEIT